MDTKEVEKSREACRVFLTTVMAKKLSVRLKIAWLIVKGLPKKGEG